MTKKRKNIKKTRRHYTKRIVKSKRATISKRKGIITSSLIDYCKSCHRKRIFKENRSGHFCCIKCGWRNPDDW